MSKVLVTTSWDDGHHLDLKLANLLDKYHLKGTFYITKNFKDRMKEKDIVGISKIHEIGAHTISHQNLLKISSQKAEGEIAKSKKWLEELTGKEIRMFSYPFGYYDSKIINIVKNVGFRGARTTKRFVVESFKNPFEIGTTINVYPQPFRKKDRSHYFWSDLFQPFFQAYPGAKRLGISIIDMLNWKRMAFKAFDIALEKGEVFHLWGHSWEIEKYGMWYQLEEVFKYLATQKNIFYLTNGQILENFLKIK